MAYMRTAGVIYFWIPCPKRWSTYGELSVHLFVRRDHRQWGFSKEWYDGPLCYFGLGRLILFAW